MNRLIYDKPADKWNDAMPLGNGYLGAMIGGKPDKEVLYMNEDSLVAGGPVERMNPAGKEHLKEIRELLLRHEVEQVQKLAPRYFYSVIPQSQHYEPLGQVYIEFGHKKAQSYVRMLDLQCAVASIEYEEGEVHYTRECFLSYPDNVCVYYIKSDVPKKVDFDLYLMRRDIGFGKSDSFLTEIEGEGSEIYLSGHNGSCENGLSYTMGVSVQTADGQVNRCGGRLVIEHATEAVVYVTGRTTYRSENPRLWCEDHLETVKAKPFSEIKAKHIQDFRKYYDQMELKLGNKDEAAEKMSIPERLQNVREGKTDTDLLETFFHMGRYLLISSSREGSLPANLQGIWNGDFTPYWGSRYTININTQMNYWLAEKAGLPSMHLPLMELQKKMFPRGKKMAQELYGCRGACAHHNTDIWGDCAPTDYYQPSTIWALGFVWLSLHIFEHYEYTRDKDFIKEYFPIIKENALFLLDYMFADENGAYESGPSVSPENTFLTPEGVEGSICMSPAMDIQIIREFFLNYLRLLEELKCNNLKEEVQQRLAHLPQTKVGKYGQIMEWDEDYEETEPGHRHISQLFALYPGTQIRPDTTPELAKAAEITIERRTSNGGGQGGWCSAWIALWYARLKQGQKAYETIVRMLREYTFDSLLENFAGVFQIDGNFSGATAVLEMLVQDFGGEIYILPSLPEQLKSGEIKGLRLRAGAVLDMKWENGAVQKLEIRASVPMAAKCVFNGMTLEVRLEKNGVYRFAIPPAYNPYLPGWEYVPDGEPRVFGDRLYIYGSHDKAHGSRYCEEDYVGWSAPVDALGDWRYEGVIYRKEQDGKNADGKKLMFAPDVVKGVDGRYYLYYGLSDVKYIGVAVSDDPAGPFSYYGEVKKIDGGLEGLAFDPGVLVEGEQVYLYYGFAPRKEELENPRYQAFGQPMKGSYMVRLDKDMKTIISEPVMIANADLTAEGTSFEAHPFFEASSIRRIGTRYYYVYSSIYGHELCYAIGERPEGPFHFKGVIVSNGDIGISDRPTAYEANNHGGIAQVGDNYYIFYHRHTHGTHYSRQGCAEKIQIQEDGTIAQVEITSCGMNEGPLDARKKHPAYIICNLHGPGGACKIPSKPPYDETVPYLTEEERVLYLHNMRDGAACGVKYLAFDGETECRLTLKGGKGIISIYLDQEDGKCIGTLCKDSVEEGWTQYQCKIHKTYGTHGVWFAYHMEDTQEAVDMLDFEFTV